MASKSGRIKSEISRYIAEIVRGELKKPSIGLVCVNEVIVSDDYSYADVYVTFLGDQYPKQKLAELKKAEGYVRSSLAKKLSIYKVPKVRFLLDETALSAQRIEDALAKESEQIASFPGNEADE